MSMKTYLMKYVIAKQLEHVSVAVFCPTKITIEFCAVDHRAELGQQSKKSGRFDLFCQLGFYDVVVSECSIDLIVESRT